MKKRFRFTDAAAGLTASVLVLILSFVFSDEIAAGAVKVCGEVCSAAAAVLTENESGTDTLPAIPETQTEKPEEKSAPADGEYRIPDDVLTLQREYAASVSEDMKAGKVTELAYITTGATDEADGIQIKNATAALHPDFEALLKEKSDLKVEDKSKPTVLIFHTHTTESYLLTDDGAFYKGYETKSTDPARNVVRVGDEICRALEENGIGYIHDTKIYDEAYNGAYARSRESVERYLRENPEIQIVLDVHRDAFYNSDTDRVKTAYTVNGKKAAQIMIISGAEDSGITDFPDWEYNLRFALEIQKAAGKYYGLMKPLYFCPRRYNMNTAHCSLLMEFGTDANTLEEAVYSGHLMGDILAQIIKEHS